MTFFCAGRIVSGTIVAILLGASSVAAQTPTLAEVAKQEQDRRKVTPPPTKVLTNKDLPKVVSPGTPAVPADAAKTDAASEPEATKTAQEPREPVKDEVWWRARISDPRERMHRDEVLLDALQARVNGLTSDFTGRDDPYQRARIGEDRQKAIVEMERVRIEIGELKKKIDDIEEEARRASVPPGWLR
jgi:cell division septation protein DedD